MTFTYSQEELDKPVAQVRTRIGDTNKGQQMLEDEEIKQVLTEQGLSLTATLTTKSADSAALAACKQAIARKTRDIDRNNVGMSATRSQVIANLKEICKMLEADLGSKGAEPFAGGTSISRKEALAADTDFPRLKIERGQHSINGVTDSRRRDPDC